jgi:tetratricopeptide (TPR) repeat protein
VAVYRNRGNARRARGDWDGAIADFTHAIALDPRNADAHAWRGWSRLIADRDGADEDAKAYLALRPRDEKSTAYMAILGTFAARRNSRDAEADGFLAEALANTSPRSWPAPALRYLRHTITAKDLLAAAADDGQTTEAHAFLGIDLLLAGHKTAAAEHLRWTRDHGTGSPVALDLAREALRRIETLDPSPAPLPLP